jgi:hypothetical protein
MLQKEFVPPQESLELKKLGFNEPCLKFYVDGMLALVPDAENGDTNSKLNGYNPLYVSAPTFSQAFRWFRENHNLHHEIEYNGYEYLGYVSGMTANIFKTYEEAELACLRKLIEIVQGGNK